MRILIALFIGLGFFSCKKKTYYLRSVENRMDVPVEVDIYWTEGLPRNAYKNLAPGETFIFWERDTKGLERNSPNCSSDIDSVKLFMKDQYGRSFPLFIDWQSPGAWVKNTAEPKSFIEHTCTLVIGDFESPSPF